MRVRLAKERLARECRLHDRLQAALDDADDAGGSSPPEGPEPRVRAVSPEGWSQWVKHWQDALAHGFLVKFLLQPDHQKCLKIS